jgi:hypothetical protein
MPTLEPVIRVRELPPALSRVHQHWPSIRELVREVPSPDEALVLAYLAQGVAFEIYCDRGLMYDVLEPGRRLDAPDGPKGVIVQPGLVLTDGTWVWDGVLPYYVARYHLQLPERFLTFAANNGWRIDPSGIDIQKLTWDTYDTAPETSDSRR